MWFELVQDLFNIMSKSTYYAVDKKRFSYQMCPLIYDANFKVGEETSSATT